MSAMPITPARRRLLSVLPLAALAMLALAACAPTQDTVSGNTPAAPPASSSSSETMPTPSDTPPAADGVTAQCDAAAAQSLVGNDASESTIADARRAAGAKGDVRMIKPGQAVTMDFRGDRLNVEVDARNAIVRITCG